jgi:hypothetical protein
VGQSNREFNAPKDFAFDNEGNLYVCDTNNHRIQVFVIIDNQPCSATSTSNSGSSFSICFFFKNIYSLIAHLETTSHIRTTSPVPATTVITPLLVTTIVKTSSSATTAVITLPPATTTTVITSPPATTIVIKSHAVSSHWNCYYTGTLTMATLTIVLWIIPTLV